MNNDRKIRPAIIFDFGGVLIDWNPYYVFRHFFGDDQKVIERFMQEIDFAGWNRENDRGRSLAQGAAELAARFPKYREPILAYNEHYLDAIGGVIQPVVDILHLLKEQGYPLYGLSNWPAEKFEIVRPIYPFFDWFDDLVISGEVKLIKPDQAIFELMLRRVGLPAQDCIYIDDLEQNIAMGMKLGFHTILFKSPEQLVQELRGAGIDLNAK